MTSLLMAHNCWHRQHESHPLDRGNINFRRRLVARTSDPASGRTLEHSCKHGRIRTGFFIHYRQQKEVSQAIRPDPGKSDPAAGLSDRR